MNDYIKTLHALATCYESMGCLHLARIIRQMIEEEK